MSDTGFDYLIILTAGQLSHSTPTSVCTGIILNFYAPETYQLPQWVWSFMYITSKNFDLPKVVGKHEQIFPTWWFNGDLPLYKVKNHLKQTKEHPEVSRRNSWIIALQNYQTWHVKSRVKVLQKKTPKHMNGKVAEFTTTSKFPLKW